MAGLFLTKTDVVISGALDGLAARHRVYANNIANLETPGFQPSEVPFETQLRRMRDEMAANPASPSAAHILALDPVPERDFPLTSRDTLPQPVALSASMAPAAQQIS